jgi:hypothetical protein
MAIQYALFGFITLPPSTATIQPTATILNGDYEDQGAIIGLPRGGSDQRAKFLPSLVHYS